MTPLQRVKLRVHLKALPQYILVLCTLFLTAWLTNRYAEAVCFSISFCAFRYKFTDVLHCSTTLRCILLTNGIAISTISIILPLTQSLFGGLFAGFAVNYFASLVSSHAVRMEEKSELRKLQGELNLRNVHSMSESELRIYCKSFNLDIIDEEIVVQRLIYHLKGVALYEKIGYSKPQMIRREKRIEQKLGISLKDH